MNWLDGIHLYFVDSGLASRAPDNWFYHYQTFLSGILALFAAILTVIAIRLQSIAAEKHHKEAIRSAHEQHTEMIERQYRSVRANLPMALSELSTYSEECQDVLVEIFSKNKNGKTVPLEIEVPSLPSNALRTITDLIALSEDRDAKMLQALLRFIQIQYSRLQGEARRLSPKLNSGSFISTLNLRNRVLDAFILKKMTDHIFPFSRWRDEHIPSYDITNMSETSEFSLETSFDQETVDFVTSKLLRFTKMAFDEKK